MQALGVQHGGWTLNCSILQRIPKMLAASLKLVLNASLLVETVAEPYEERLRYTTGKEIFYVAEHPQARSFKAQAIEVSLLIVISITVRQPQGLPPIET